MANTNVFSRAPNTFAGSFAADGTALSFSAQGQNGQGAGDNFSVGMVTQSLGISFAQSISQLFELGSNNTYYVVGRAQGQMQLNRILGPAAVQLAFYTKFGNGCNAQNNTIQFTLRTRCDGDNAGVLAVTVSNAVIVNLGLNVGAQDMIIQEASALRFTSLTYDDEAPSQAPVLVPA